MKIFAVFFAVIMSACVHAQPQPLSNVPSPCGADITVTGYPPKEAGRINEPMLEDLACRLKDAGLNTFRVNTPPISVTIKEPFYDGFNKQGETHGPDSFECSYMAACGHEFGHVWACRTTQDERVAEIMDNWRKSATNEELLQGRRPPTVTFIGGGCGDPDHEKGVGRWKPWMNRVIAKAVCAYAKDNSTDFMTEAECLMEDLGMPILSERWLKSEDW